MADKQDYDAEKEYLEFVKLNIGLKKQELESVQRTSAIGGAGPKSGRRIAETHAWRLENLPDKDEPYFVRVDLVNGQTCFYGFSTLSQANSSPSIPQSHSGVEHYLVYSRNQDGHGWSVYHPKKFPEVLRRRIFTIRNGELIEFKDELNAEIPVKSQPVIQEKVSSSQQLKETMSESRTDSLKPVGATLQEDQFEITRESFGTLLTIQGPPGSGKTVVLLERLTRIAFADKETKDKGMLLVGPNQQFLEYVRDALEKYGGSEVLLSTPEELTNWKYEKVKENEIVRGLKGLSSFTFIIDHYFSNLPEILDRGYSLKIGDIDLHFSVIDSLRLIDLHRRDKASYQQIRNRAGVSLANLLTERFFQFWESRGKQRSQFDGDPYKLIQATSTYRTILRNIYPDVSAEDVLRQIKKSPRLFIDCAKQYLSTEQIENWLKYVIEKDFVVTESDVPILDYIDSKINGTDENWGHIAIDETQDLTPMQLMMIKRRINSSNSLTLSGDLAQATGPMFYETWEEITRFFNADGVKNTELTQSFRVPSQILNYANRFLQKSLTKVRPAEPFLEISDSLQVHSLSEPEQRVELARLLIEEAFAQNQSVLLVSDSENVKIFSEKYDGRSDKNYFKAYLAEDVKGLEFEVVLLLNPLQIIDELEYENDRLARLFYVITTRSTKKLHVIGSSTADINDPISAYQRFKEQNDSDEASDIMTFEDLEEISYQEDSPGEVTETIQAEYSIPSMSRKFGLEIETLDPFMLTNDWFYLGLSNLPCISCAYRQQQVFRKHEVGDLGNVSHPGCFICLSCLVARRGNVYSDADLVNVDLELDFQNQVSRICGKC